MPTIDEIKARSRRTAKVEVIMPAGGTKVPRQSVILPDVIVADSGEAAPTVCLRGTSGTGKTTAIAHLMAAGRNVLYIDVENKYQALTKFRPMILPLAAPVTNTATGAKRLPTPTEVWQRAWQFVERLSAGDYREHNGQPIEIIAGDGIMEIAQVAHRHFKDNIPRAESTGAKDTRAMYDDYGEKVVEFIGALRSAASSAMSAFGMAPVGMVWTVGEVSTVDKFGTAAGYRPLVKGNIIPQRLPYMFEAVLRLAVERGTEAPLYVMHTVGEEGMFEAKCPGVGTSPTLAARVENWNFAEIYTALEAYYRGTEVTT